MGNKIMSRHEIDKRYDIKKTLGMGSFAVVKLAVRKSDGEQFAIKVIKRSKLNEEELQLVHEEVAIMNKIEHENCAQFFEMFETSKKIYMVMELLTGGELFDRIVAKGSYSEKEASDLIRKIASAIEYLHGIGIVHRDLKPENLIYQSKADDSEIKITDFGLAKFKGKDVNARMTTACGTPGYVAPEVLRGDEYGKEVDLWSLGVILYILLCGYPPFSHENTAQLYKLIKKAQYEFHAQYWADVTPQAKELITCLLEKDTKKRYTATQVLRHPWIAGAVAPSKGFGQAHNTRLKLMQARMRFRRGVRTIIAVNKFAHGIGAIIKDIA
jgi:calcium/calmodulin-dependent protein kinase I